MTAMLEEIVGAVQPEDFFSTGCTLVDCMLGGGFARGRIANVAGLEGSGKTLLAMESAANFLRKWPNGRIIYAEPEGALDPYYYADLGIPIDRFEFRFTNEIDTIEKFADDLFSVCKDVSVPTYYILDSLDSLASEDEIESGKSEGYNLGKPKMLSALFRKAIHMIAAKKVALLVISQLRENLAGGPYNPWRRAGGKALDFYSTHILWLNRSGTIEKQVDGVKVPVGIKVRAKLRKSKLNFPKFREVNFYIVADWGIEDTVSCLEFLHSNKKLDLVEEGASLTGLKRRYAKMEGSERKEFAEYVASVTREFWNRLHEREIRERKYEFS